VKKSCYVSHRQNVLSPRTDALSVEASELPDQSYNGQLTVFGKHTTRTVTDLSNAGIAENKSHSGNRCTFALFLVLYCVRSGLEIGRFPPRTLTTYNMV
jgi:hypothetical protein